MQNFSHAGADIHYAQGFGVANSTSIVNHPEATAAMPEELPAAFSTDAETPPVWRKAIPQARDRMQSRILVWVGLPVLAYHTLLLARWLPPLGHASRHDDIRSLPYSLVFALAAWRLGAATPLAAISGALVCQLLTSSSQSPYGFSAFHSALTPLILVVVLTFEATRIRRQRLPGSRPIVAKKGRSGAQIIANLGLAGLFSSGWGEKIFYWLAVRGSSFGFSGREGHAMYIAFISLPVLAALAEAAADTVSSEIGQAFGGKPYLLTNNRRVPPGTDGAVTFIGTVAGITAAALVAFCGSPALGMPIWECLIAFVSGVAGLIFDSLLGATVESKGWIGNDLVNFFSTAFTVVVSLVAFRLLSPWPES